MNEIYKIAKEYVDSFGEVYPGYKYGYSDLREFSFKYYFDFIFLSIDNQIPTEPLVAGGACGFIIDKKTKEIEVLTFCDLGELEDSEKELEELYEKLLEIKEESKSLMWLKSKYNLSSHQLLRVKKIIHQTSFIKEKIKEQLNELITTANMLP